jgi:hypothetical protein
MERESPRQRSVEANSTGGQGSQRGLEPGGGGGGIELFFNIRPIFFFFFYLSFTTLTSLSRLTLAIPGSHTRTHRSW